MGELIPVERIENRIFMIRGKKVMIDKDLAELYGVSTKRLNEQVRRNLERFPEDFMLRLTVNEKEQLVANCDRFEKLKHSSSLPYAFAEQGVAMLSSVLKSKRAIQVNIVIMRAFVRIRQMLFADKELAYKLAKLEQKLERHNGQIEKHDVEIQAVFKAIRKLMAPPKPKKFKIGFIRRD